MFRPSKAAALLVLLVLLIGVAVVITKRSSRAPPQGPLGAGPGSQFTEKLLALEERERQMENTVWAKEIDAERYGQIFESLWDAFNSASNKFAVLQAFQVGELTPPTYGEPESLPHGVRFYQTTNVAAPWKAEDWSAFLARMQQ